MTLGMVWALVFLALLGLRHPAGTVVVAAAAAAAVAAAINPDATYGIQGRGPLKSFAGFTCSRTTTTMVTGGGTSGTRQRYRHHLRRRRRRHFGQSRRSDTISSHGDGTVCRASVGIDNNNNNGGGAAAAGNVWNREFYTYIVHRDDSLSRHPSNRSGPAGISAPTATHQRQSQSDSHSQSYNMSYHFRPASPGHEHLPPILFIHPVGIGLASWFWEGLYAAYASSSDTAASREGGGGGAERQGHPSLYAVNLMGCGVTTEENAAMMDWTKMDSPTNDAETVPMLWVEQCETLLKLIRQRHVSSSTSSSSSSSSSMQPTRVAVVAQGGLAPIAIQLASRNPDTVHSLILTSPPLWSELTTAIPKDSLDFNFRFLNGPLGPLAFSLLETRWAVEFFSNLFLFGSQNTPCDSTWLDRALEEAGSDVRPPVQVFNAGYCQSQSYERELRELQQPTLILHGRDDLRQRSDFVQCMRLCQVRELPGKNVLPWESPHDVAAAVHLFLWQQQQQQQSATSV